MKVDPGLFQSKNVVDLRECVHCPVMVVTSDSEVIPGEHVKFIDNDCENRVLPWFCVEESHGIADPFLRSYIPPNTPFLMFLLPGKVKNIHHEFDIEL